MTRVAQSSSDTLDWYREAAIFFRLSDLAPGDPAVVPYDDASSATFREYHRGQYPKDRFPASLIYANTLRAELQLITCGGRFDRSTGHYRNNLLVWAATD